MASVLLKIVQPSMGTTRLSAAACREGGVTLFPGALNIPDCSILMDEATQGGSGW
ncbi:hypothetical protein AFE_1804 [Acidithiobacillus ferrooxidans ATCC 23270]|uniref:Uncharacterized protein n=1 Tax=Acidithiobacillus ferrooxidans (strain ATCC 23270 / DSM 14882 / CIP 104768 / NCIMB 8455) TaxID=243159 RepID=B7JBR0_ACIF2|nr:hypothetical protein AFE_1804 [Acidithiobacillus ferrooxidans ATCC 23270]